MRERMDSLLDKERREEIARNDAALIASMFPLVPTVCRAKGNHLSAQNDEPLLDVFPELVELNALECAKLREAQHTDAWHRRNDAQARALDQQHFDVLRRTGVL